MRLRFAPLLLLLAGCGPQQPPHPDPAPGVPPVQGGTTDADRPTASTRLHQVGIALHNYESSYQQFPAGIACTPTKECPAGVGLSWRVQLLPYLDQDALYKQFKLDEPWDSEHNTKLVPKMPAVFASPGKEAPFGLTYLRAFQGDTAYLDPRGFGQPVPGRPLRGRRMTSITDGTANTLIVAEAGVPAIWTKPDELDFDGKTVPKLGGVFVGGFHGLMGDGQVFFFPKDVTTDDIVRSAITANGYDDGVKLNPIRKANGVKEWGPPKPPPPDGPKPPVAKPPK